MSGFPSFGRQLPALQSHSEKPAEDAGLITPDIQLLTTKWPICTAIFRFLNKFD